MKSLVRRIDEKLFNGKVREFYLSKRAPTLDQVAEIYAEKFGADDLARASLTRSVLEKMYDPKLGLEYGLTRADKEELVRKVIKITSSVKTATSWLYHLIMMIEILKIPKSVAGDIVECGCYQGASTSSLSLIAKATGRKLLVCDSFEGLPNEEKAMHHYPHLGVYGYYEAGMYEGRLEDVKRNIREYGDIDSCVFIKGFYENTLSSINGPIAFVFADVDLLSSLTDCIRFLWPKLIPDGFFYTDDSCDMEVVRIWFDENWWKDVLGQRAPGYVGSGCGLPLDPNLCSLGYTRKILDYEKSYNKVSWLIYPEKQ